MKGITVKGSVPGGKFGFFTFYDQAFRVSRRYEIRLLIVIILSLYFLAIPISSGSLAILPSSFIISTSAPPGLSPASRVRSIAASVCPGRRRTPFVFAFSGKMCPGLPRSSGLVSGSTNALIVLALSGAEIPVVQPWPSRSTTP